MIRRSFRMTLKEGRLEEYKKAHDEVWPEITQALNSAEIGRASCRERV